MTIEDESREAGFAECKTCGHRVPFIENKMLMLMSHHCVALHPNPDPELNKKFLNLPKPKRK